MQKNILILDDDIDFNSLLTDVFRQDDFNVISIQDPRKAVEVFRANDFDLVVTDFLMPEMTGTVFVSKIREIRAEVPVVVVSGFLEKNTIKDFLEKGVEIIFLKPLNIFSLLKRAKAVIEEAERADEQSGLPVEFQSFPGKSASTRELAQQLYANRNFRSNLLLVGEEGSQFKRVCRDLFHFHKEGGEHLYFLQPGASAEGVLSELTKLNEDSTERITLAVLNTEKLSNEEQSIIYRIAQGEKPFDDLPGEVRFVFCLNRDSETLFEEGLIDERFFQFLGGLKVIVPPLRECVEDISALARQILQEEVNKSESHAKAMIEGKALDYLEKRNWPGNFTELQDLMRIAFKMGRSPLIQVEDFEKAQDFEDLDPKKIKIENLQEYVKGEQEEYTKAVYNLLEGEKGNKADLSPPAVKPPPAQFQSIPLSEINHRVKK